MQAKPPKTDSNHGGALSPIKDLVPASQTLTCPSKRRNTTTMSFLCQKGYGNNNNIKYIYYPGKLSLSGFPGGSDGKRICLQCRFRLGFDPWIRKIPLRSKWLPTPVSLPGEFHGQRSLVGYSPWGHKELDMTKQLTLSLFFSHVDNFIK